MIEITTHKYVGFLATTVCILQSPEHNPILKHVPRCGAADVSTPELRINGSPVTRMVGRRDSRSTRVQIPYFHTYCKRIRLLKITLLCQTCILRIMKISGEHAEKQQTCRIIQGCPEGNRIRDGNCSRLYAWAVLLLA